jgi:hypothetical protein
MKQTFVTDVQLAHFTALFQRLAPAYAERWITLLQGKPVKWRKIKPWRAWPCDVDHSHPPHLKWEEIVDAAIALAQVQKVREAYVLDCYHGTDGVETLALAQLKARLCSGGPGGWVLEGFVSLIPGQLALATNHEGGCWLINYTAPKVLK